MTESNLPELSIDWIRDTDLIEAPPQARRLLEKYAQVPSSQVLDHINRVRAKALEIYPYPCIGHYRFLDIQIIKSKAYDEILSRVAGGEALLDVGCCIGQELRQLASDGAGSQNLTGVDLYESFFDVGYALFQDRDRFQGTFFSMDLFNPPAAAMTSLDASMNIVWTCNVLHLFVWEQQCAALAFMLRTLRATPNAMIAGRFMGHSSSGKYNYSFQGQNVSIYRHNGESFRKLLEEMTGSRKERWELDVDAPEWTETLKLQRQFEEDQTWTLEIKFIARIVE